MNDIAWLFFSTFMFVMGYGFGIFISNAAKRSFLAEKTPQPTINDIMKWINEDKMNSSNQEDASPQQTKENQ